MKPSGQWEQHGNSYKAWQRPAARGPALSAQRWPASARVKSTRHTCSEKNHDRCTAGAIPDRSARVSVRQAKCWGEEQLAWLQPPSEWIIGVEAAGQWGEPLVRRHPPGSISTPEAWLRPRPALAVTSQVQVVGPVHRPKWRRGGGGRGAGGRCDRPPELRGPGLGTFAQPPAPGLRRRGYARGSDPRTPRRFGLQSCV